MIRTVMDLPETWSMGQQQITLSFIARPIDLNSAMGVIYEMIDTEKIMASLQLQKARLSIRSKIYTISETNVSEEAVEYLRLNSIGFEL
jgi:hypothetical protein